MRLDTSQQMRTDMKLRMAPRMIQSMEILQLPLLALQERIDQELIENPLLIDLRESEAPESDTNSVEDGTPAENYDEWDNFGETHRLSRSGMSDEADRKHDAMQNMASRPESLHDDLSRQLGYLDSEPKTRAFAEFMIYNLDDNGFLKSSLADCLRDFGEDATLADAEEALDLVQRLDPPGVGARNLKECLLLQLTPETPCREVLFTLISNHLEDLGQNRLPAIEKKTGFSIDVIKEAMEVLSHLNTRPGASFTPEHSEFVLPDLIVEPTEQGEYEVRLLNEHTPQLSISRLYQQMLKDKSADPVTREFIQKKIQSARWLIESIEQRRSTLLKVAKAIIEHQKDFLDKGPEAIEPLKMQQIAERVHVHVTTVSRAVDDKWIQTPRGIFALKRFFGGGTTTADGEEVAWDTIKQKLLEVIGKEDKQNPLSDEELVDALSQSGLPVARRTVTKYRKALRIPSSRQRRIF
jgi:RNA polymerase sigma-54 factor